MDDAVDNADLHFFEYVTSKYPNLGIAYPEEIRDALNERVVNSRNRCKDIGLLRKSILAEYVRKTSYPIEIVDELFDVWRTERRKTTLMPYACELIQLLHQNGYKIAVITNGTSDLSNHPSINSLIDAFVSPEICGDSKPSVSEIIGVFDPRIYLHVGDSYETDVLGAMCAGWNSVLITKKPTIEYVCPPSLIVRSLDELYFMFKEALESCSI
ncbi:hydrolase [Blastocystis sp. subtype 4]|uniref:hydrolase n=1 Tax=Blastocystis sp. subtype 4 TaxID=944170 RepID=UPI0007121794|nr:hydrolase [Blastocystis sp. subtype 4]KNB45437.1 hydrolase [Blastocystis sp. subtype 4]|eukprot:XP_014528880.1 hydrolase [Blastocystis sp. subtype 4]